MKRLGPALLVFGTLAFIAGCKNPAFCEDGYVKRESSTSWQVWLCTDLCRRCGFDESSAVCQETDDWAYCQCADGNTATWCDAANEEGMRCGASGCD